MAHNPKELFTTNAITRESIAQDLNNIISGHCNQEIEEFADNDSRLTSEACYAYAKFLNSNDDEEACDEYLLNLVEQLGVTIPQWVD